MLQDLHPTPPLCPSSSLFSLCELCPCHTGYLGIPGAASLMLPQGLRTCHCFSLEHAQTYVDYFSGLHPSQLLEVSTPKLPLPGRPFLIASFIECYVHCLPQVSALLQAGALMVPFSVHPQP